MHNFLSNPPRNDSSRRYCDNWLRFRLNDYVYNQRLDRKNGGAVAILPESYIKRNSDDNQSIVEDFPTPEYEESLPVLNPVLAGKVRKAISMLTGRERQIVLHLFDFGDGEYSQADFGKKYNLSHSWVSELHKKAICKLRKHLEADITEVERLEIVEHLNLRQGRLKYDTNDPPDG